MKKIHITKGTSGDLRLTNCGKWLPLRNNMFTVHLQEATCKTCLYVYESM